MSPAPAPLPLPGLVPPDDPALVVARLVAARWAFLVIALALILLVPVLLVIPLPWLPLLAVVTLGAAWNLLVQHRLRKEAPCGRNQLTSNLMVDLCLFDALLFFSGGATNPMISLLLLPVAVAALTLPPRHTAAVVALAVALYSMLMFWFVPLPLSDPDRAAQLHVSGMWLTFSLSAGLIAMMVLRMTASIRQRDRALAEAREHALRDERVVALGALAAGAAHELGTPLATVALLADEIDAEDGLGEATRADLALIRQQIAHCKHIISRLADQAGARRLDSAAALPADQWLRALFEPWCALRPEAGATLNIGAPGTAPAVLFDPTIAQGIVNLLNNAADAGGPVEVELAWDASSLTLSIRDHGPGFPAAVLAGAGTRAFPGHGRGSGIGLLLTFAAIERLGGALTLSNPPGGGGLARVELPLVEPAR